MNSDIINGLFEFASSIFLSMNVFKLHKDKKVMGVSLVGSTFFAAWGCWNIYFYPSINMPYSFMGGLCICIVNFVWISQMIYYTYYKNKTK